MILLIFAIVMSILFLAVEIPVFVRYKDENDLFIAIAAGIMLVACIAVLLWR